MAQQLRFSVEGRDYEQNMRLFYGDVQVFFGVADDFVTSVSGHLQIRMNFSGQKSFMHTLKRSGEFAVLVPEVEDRDAREYLESVRGVPLIWCIDELSAVWKELRYDSEELSDLQPVNPDEMFLGWLISSGYVSESVVASVFSRTLEKSIVAEVPEGEPSVQFLVQQLSERKRVLEGIERYASDTGHVTVYIEEAEGSIREWKALSLDRQLCLMGDFLAVKIL